MSKDEQIQHAAVLLTQKTESGVFLDLRFLHGLSATDAFLAVRAGQLLLTDPLKAAHSATERNTN